MNLQGIWTYYHSENSPLSKEMGITRLAAGSDGRIWAEVYEEVRGLGKPYGIMMFDQDKWTLFPLTELDLSGPVVAINRIGCDQSGCLWLYLVLRSAKHILCCFDGRTTKIFLAGENGLPSDIGTSSAFAGDIKGDLWVAMGLMGVYYFNGFEWQRFTAEDCRLTNGWITNVNTDHLGRLWFAVQEPRFTTFVWYDGQRCEEYAKASVGYEIANVQALAFDKKGKLWVGWGDSIEESRIGLWVFNQAGHWETYTTKNSVLADNQVHSIAFDKVGRAWVATSEGVTIFWGEQSVCWGAINPEVSFNPIRHEEVISKLETGDMYPHNPYDLLGRGVVVDKQGQVWVCSIKGLSVFSEV